jgi:hypothetical protein
MFISGLFVDAHLYSIDPCCYFTSYKKDNFAAVVCHLRAYKYTNFQDPTKVHSHQILLLIGN